MRGSVDPARESTDHRQSGISQLICEFFCRLVAVMRSATRADNPDCMLIALLKFAPNVKNDWRRVDLAERFGIGRRILRYDGRAELFDPFQLRRKIDNRLPILNL